MKVSAISTGDREKTVPLGINRELVADGIFLWESAGR
jgi:hypothetical protein